MQEYNPSPVTNIVIFHVSQDGQYLWENEQASVRSFQGQNGGENCRLISPSLLSLNLVHFFLLCSTLLLSERTSSVFLPIYPLLGLCCYVTFLTVWHQKQPLPVSDRVKNYTPWKVLQAMSKERGNVLPALPQPHIRIYWCIKCVCHQAIDRQCH